MLEAAPKVMATLSETSSEEDGASSDEAPTSSVSLLDPRPKRGAVLSCSPSRSPSFRSRSRSASRKPAGIRRFAVGSREYEKHSLYRRANDMVDGIKWQQHPSLLDWDPPVMPARQLDLLHIIYLFLEGLGLDPRVVNQIWALDQSIARRLPKSAQLTFEGLQGVSPAIPGLVPRMEWHPRFDGIAVSPCICRRSWLFINRERKFATAGDKLRLQGVLSLSSRWSQCGDRQLALAAGDAFVFGLVFLYGQSVSLCMCLCVCLCWYAGVLC